MDRNDLASSERPGQRRQRRRTVWDAFHAIFTLIRSLLRLIENLTSALLIVGVLAAIAFVMSVIGHGSIIHFLDMAYAWLREAAAAGRL